jgi:hypothetical protein
MAKSMSVPNISKCMFTIIEYSTLSIEVVQAVGRKDNHGELLLKQLGEHGGIRGD